MKKKYNIEGDGVSNPITLNQGIYPCFKPDVSLYKIAFFISFLFQKKRPLNANGNTYT